MRDNKSFIESHFENMGIHCQMHNPSRVETWVRQLPNGIKIGVIWYSKFSDTWVPESKTADSVKEPGA